MTDTQQRAAAKAFAKNWKDRGYEKGDSQIFWVELLTTVFGVTEISQFISFEDQVHLDHTSFIDGYIEKTHVMIEQKSINKSLTAAIRQSDGSMLTPFEQAKRYSSELPYSKRPRWIVTSNFQSFYIYDMEKPGGDPEIIQLEDLEKEYYRLQFLVDEGNTNLQREMEVSIAAGEIVGLLYDALAKQYVDPTTERAMKSLNILCVRMVFCLYAEDAGIFGQHAFIVEGNSLQIDWESVVPKNQVSYIMGNPPFHGFTFMTAEQKQDMQNIFPGVKNLDFVCAWYKKASDYIRGTKIEVAFVSTNSIVQGETVSRFWDFMQDDIINFAYRTFVWDSEASVKAHVHCVIIGFAKFSRSNKYLYDNGRTTVAENINRYLMDGDNILVRSRNKPLCDIPKMIYGNKPADGGNLIIEDEDLNEFIKKDPNAKKYIHPLLGASEYIKGNKRWCLWLVGADPEDLKKCPMIMERIKKCKEARENSVAAGIRKFAATPTLFAQRTQPVDKDFIIVPRVSSQARRYVPMGFIKAGTIVTDRVQVIPDASLYDFGIIISNIHMAWMRVTCMRLKSDYSYSKDVVYNNFPWPEPTEQQKEKIEKTAQAILDARALYPNSSLATLYDELTMPPELRKAHQQNDMAVMQAYGFTKGSEAYKSEAACVAELMKRYQKLCEEQK